jgi:hypothetical protein
LPAASAEVYAVTHDSDTRPKHKSDFTALYDLLDPGPYYQGLEPANYRMPDVVAGFLRNAGDAISRARGSPETLKVLDFASGYGANGTLLRHDLRMHDLYAYYASRVWRQTDGDVHWQTDRRFFARHRLGQSKFEIAGLDIAANALAYASSVGLIDHAFSDDLVTKRAGDELKAYLAEVDIVIESGALGPGLRNAFSNVLADASANRRPWFVYSPRPDVDWTELNEFWSRVGYRADACNQSPVHYRRALSASECEEMVRDCAACGRPVDKVILDGYLAVDLMLARPLEDAEPAHRNLQEIFAELPVVSL